MLRVWLLTRNPNWSFQKLSVMLVRSIRIPVCDALIQKNHCFQITIGFITLTAVINVLGYMLFVTIFVLLGKVRHIGFVALLVSAILVSAILDNRYNGNISILVHLLLRFECDIFKWSSYLCVVCLFKNLNIFKIWLKLCLGPVVLSLCVFYVGFICDVIG